jgi:hypothetical protein
MEPEGSLLCSQKPTTGPYPEPAESISSPRSLSPLRSILMLSKESVRVRGALKRFVAIKIFYGEGLLDPRPTHKLEDQPLSAVRDCLFNIFATTLHNQRTSIHQQPKDAPCRVDERPTQHG